MITTKLNIKKKYILFGIIVVLLVGISLLSISNFLSEKTLKGKLKNRALLIVIENNFSLSPEIVEEYDENKNLVDLVFSWLFKVEKVNLENNNLTDITDMYGENYLAERFKKTAKNYGEIIVLTDQDASYENFKKTLLKLNEDGKIIDILLHLHGSRENVYFYNESIAKERISNDKDIISSKKTLNIGYLYQTVCYSGEDLEIWLNWGVKVASGSKMINSFVVFAPERFLHLWSRGNSYYESVNESFDFEVSIWKTIGRFFPTGTFATDERSLDSSEMLFIGDRDYVLD